jgi:hypothetical protein
MAATNNTESKTMATRSDFMNALTSMAKSDTPGGREFRAALIADDRVTMALLMHEFNTALIDAARKGIMARMGDIYTQLRG